MYNSKVLSGRSRPIIVYFVPFLVIMTGLVVFFIVREDRQAEAALHSELRESARALYEQIAVARLWNARHGGVYAEITPDTRPNPYLDPSGRDITAQDGRRFTKINPAYMTRQLSEIANSGIGYRFRIVGLRPLNPANRPDAWEERALRSLGSGTETEASVIRDESGRRFFDYLVPLRIEQPCLSCHGAQGYREGDIKGAIVVRVPMEKFEAIHRASTGRSMFFLSAIGALGVLFTAAVMFFASRRLDREIRKNLEREKTVVAVELAGAAAHELRQPMTVVMCMQSAIQDTLKRGEPVTEEDLQVLKRQCSRMNEIIDRLLAVTNYKSRQYDRDRTIMDIDASTAEPETGREPGSGK